MRAFYWSVLAAVIWGVAPVIEKMGLASLTPVHGVFFRVVGISLVVIIAVCFYPSVLQSITGYPLKSIMYVVLGGFMAAVVGQLFFYNALKTGEASKVVPVAASFPLITFFISFLFLGESFTIPKLIGICFILAGVYFLK